MILLAACGEAAPTESRAGSEPVPDVGRIVCEADGTTSVPTPQVEAQRDGVHLLVENRLGEGASLIGPLGFDVDPGVSERILQTGPGDHPVACWAFSDHGTGEEPGTVPFAVLDPDGLFAPPAQLECPPNNEQWASIAGFFGTLEHGVSADPAEAVRQSIKGLKSGDDVSLDRWGYPEADHGDHASVSVSRGGRVVAIFGVMLADDGRWVVGSNSGCASVGISY